MAFHRAAICPGAKGSSLSLPSREEPPTPMKLVASCHPHGEHIQARRALTPMKLERRAGPMEPSLDFELEFRQIISNNRAGGWRKLKTK